MAAELDTHAWYLIFQDLSLDAVHDYLPLMGLRHPEDVAFTRQLRPILEQFQRQKIEERKEEQLVQDVFLLSKRCGTDCFRRITAWGNFIYPNQLPHQQQAFRWQLIISRGVKNLQEAPAIIKRMKATLDVLKQILGSELQPLSDWDKGYSLEREDEGISPFEWVEGSIRNYRYRYAWYMAAQELQGLDQTEEVYRWGLRLAEMLRIPKDTLARPEESLALSGPLR